MPKSVFQNAAEEHKTRLRAELLGYYEREFRSSNELPKIPAKPDVNFLSYAAMQVRYGAISSANTLKSWKTTCETDKKLHFTQRDKDKLATAQHIQDRMDYLIKHLELSEELPMRLYTSYQIDQRLAA